MQGRRPLHSLSNTDEVLQNETPETKSLQPLQPAAPSETMRQGPAGESETSLQPETVVGELDTRREDGSLQIDQARASAAEVIALKKQYRVIAD